MNDLIERNYNLLAENYGHLQNLVRVQLLMLRKGDTEGVIRFDAYIQIANGVINASWIEIRKAVAEQHGGKVIPIAPPESAKKETVN